jgi:hypothetical protein
MKSRKRKDERDRRKTKVLKASWPRMSLLKNIGHGYLVKL